MPAGKYLNGYGKQRRHMPPGWTEWYAAASGSGGFGPFTVSGFHYPYNYYLNENGTLVWYGNDDEDYTTDIVAEKTVGFVERSDEVDDDAPFFAYVSATAPHLPGQAPTSRTSLRRFSSSPGFPPTTTPTGDPSCPPPRRIAPVAPRHPRPVGGPCVQHDLWNDLWPPLDHLWMVLFLGMDLPAYRGVRTETRLCVEWYDQEHFGHHEEELYDMTADPVAVEQPPRHARGPRGQRRPSRRAPLTHRRAHRLSRRFVPELKPMWAA